ncbi:DUF5658 family protein [Gorillibacterium sp. sgz5001074]|uniref:DUF5658 family protein n=1 Tax=Gorillibacterium sp. sgz5001074 TaxID=3446695 RepID=UPI003F673AEA
MRETAYYHKASLFLVIAGIVDASLTDLGLRLGLITEANPLMSQLYHSTVAGFYIVKILLPLILACILFLRRPSRSLISLVSAAAFIYVGILLMHTYWTLSTLY